MEKVRLRSTHIHFPAPAATFPASPLRSAVFASPCEALSKEFRMIRRYEGRRGRFSGLNLVAREFQNTTAYFLLNSSSTAFLLLRLSSS